MEVNSRLEVKASIIRASKQLPKLTVFSALSVYKWVTTAAAAGNFISDKQPDCL